MSLLEIENLSISFGGLKAVDDVSFTVEEGSVYAVIGPNGAGKSTIFNLLSRFYEPLSGKLKFANNDLLELGAKDIARLGIARTFQNLELFEHASVLQNLLVGRHVHNTQSWWRQLLFTSSVVEAELEHRTKVEEVIDFLELAHYRNQIISSLPYGLRKKVELARALCIEPKLLLLDEPSSGLNPEETEEMGFWIEDIRRDLNMTVVLIEHDMSLVKEVSDRVLAIVNGKVIAEGVHGFVQSHPEVVSAYLGDSQ